MTTEEQIDASLTKTRAHLFTRVLAGLPSATVTRVLLDPRVGKAIARVNTMADAGDLLATQQACQAWNRAVQRAVKEGP